MRVEQIMYSTNMIRLLESIQNYQLIYRETSDIMRGRFILPKNSRSRTAWGENVSVNFKCVLDYSLDVFAVRMNVYIATRKMAILKTTCLACILAGFLFCTCLQKSFKRIGQ